MDVCLFFYVDDKFYVSGCSFEKAEKYGEFLIYPESHFDIWDGQYIKLYKVDFDYFPRGRVSYNAETKKFHILYDRCIGERIKEFIENYYCGKEIVLEFDEHYRCSQCNENYVAE